ncbi:hypothetical protein LAZ67_23001008 [Cordylochernes scorpioides]|uniref:Uncharacterized protein n=1 Tax=Cordylochernes scorpioides TaxID=51811 RepID=A0ABY6LQS4_9ARAC|nr:hypothetical protein LAZ67_23001008 [Cordylochernes scorpioides]
MSKPKVVHYNRLAPFRASCCLKRSDCCLPPTPVYFLEDSRRFYELLSPFLLLLSLTVLQLRLPLLNGLRDMSSSAGVADWMDDSVMAWISSAGATNGSVLVEEGSGCDGI